MFTMNQLEILLRLRRNGTLEMPQFGLSNESSKCCQLTGYARGAG